MNGECNNREADVPCIRPCYAPMEQEKILPFLK